MEDKNQLKDGRIIKDEKGAFTELINGKWVEPIADFTVGDFIDDKKTISR